MIFRKKHFSLLKVLRQGIQPRKDESDYRYHKFEIPISAINHRMSGRIIAILSTMIMAVIIVRRSKWVTSRTSSTAVSSLAAVFDNSDNRGELRHSSDKVLLM